VHLGGWLAGFAGGILVLRELEADFWEVRARPTTGRLSCSHGLARLRGLAYGGRLQEGALRVARDACCVCVGGGLPSA